MVLRGVASYPLERDRVIEDQVREKSSVFVGLRRVMGEIKSVVLQRLPEQFRRERVVQCVVSSDDYRHVEGTPNRIRVLLVEQLHGPGDFAERY